MNYEICYIENSNLISVRLFLLQILQVIFSVERNWF